VLGALHIAVALLNDDYQDTHSAAHM
jgi:hypothetical protein